MNELGLIGTHELYHKIITRLNPSRHEQIPV